MGSNISETFGGMGTITHKTFTAIGLDQYTYTDTWYSFVDTILNFGFGSGSIPASASITILCRQLIIKQVKCD